MSKRELKLSRKVLKMSSLVISKVSLLHLAKKQCNYFINLGCRVVQKNHVPFAPFSRRSVAVVFSIVVNARVGCSCAVFLSLLGPQSACRHRADCGPSGLRKIAHEQATGAFRKAEKTTATDLQLKASNGTRLF